MKWDVENPQHRTVLETARSWGVSPSAFMGEGVYTLHYDSAGNITGTSLTPGWTEEDRNAALDLTVYESDLCPGCGHPMKETMAPENEFRYIAELPFRCHRCTATEVGMKPYEDHSAASALYLPVKLKERSETTDDESPSHVE